MTWQPTASMEDTGTKDTQAGTCTSTWMVVLLAISFSSGVSAGCQVTTLVMEALNWLFMSCANWEPSSCSARRQQRQRWVRGQPAGP